MRHSAADVALEANRSTGVQQPMPEHLLEVRIRAVHDDAAVARNRAQQQVELALDRRHVRIDVGVVVLEVVQDRGARPVVHELGALVEERRVVLVGLDHEVPAAHRAAR